MLTIENYIGGELVTPASGEYLDNVEPATGSVYSRIPDSDDRDVNLAADAARAAFPSWSKTPSEQRFEILMRLVAKAAEFDLDPVVRVFALQSLSRVAGPSQNALYAHLSTSDPNPQVRKTASKILRDLQARRK